MSEQGTRLEFKSPPLDRAVWDNVPKFAVLTGVNGAGKSRALLELSKRGTAHLISQNSGRKKVPIRFPSAALGGNEEAILQYLNDDTETEPPGRPSWHTFATQIRLALTEEGIQQPFTAAHAWSVVPSLEEVDSTWWSCPITIIGDIQSAYVKHFRARVEEAASDVKGIVQMLQGRGENEGSIIASLVDSKVRLELAEQLVRDQQQHSVLEIFNDALRSLNAPFDARLPERDKEVRFGELNLREVELSDGEKMLAFFAGVMALAKMSTQKGHVVKMLLFDEPDRHLDPRLCKTMMTALRKVSDSFQVILTTHRLDTVALAEEGELFELVPLKGAPHEFRLATRARVACRMAANVPDLGLRMRVHVEAPDDVRFYRCLYGRIFTWLCPHAVEGYYEATLLQALSNSAFKHTALLSEHFQLTFLCKQGRAGSSTVAESIKRELYDTACLHEAGLLGSSVFSAPCFHQPFGIVDRDDRRPASRDMEICKRIVCGERYALENYLLDPLFLAFLPPDQLKPLLQEPFCNCLPPVLKLLREAAERGEWQEADVQVAQFFAELAGAATGALDDAAIALQEKISQRRHRTISRHGLNQDNPSGQEWDAAEKDLQKTLGKALTDVQSMHNLLFAWQQHPTCHAVAYIVPGAHAPLQNLSLPPWFLDTKLKALRDATLTMPASVATHNKQNPLAELITLFYKEGRCAATPLFAPLPRDLVAIFFELDYHIREQVRPQMEAPMPAGQAAL